MQQVLQMLNTSLGAVMMLISLAGVLVSVTMYVSTKTNKNDVREIVSAIIAPLQVKIDNIQEDLRKQRQYL
jgi:hypothetical protein